MKLTRRRWAQALALGTITAGTQGCAPFARRLSRCPRSSVETPKVAGILTWYIKGSHADVLIGKILEGWAYDGGVGPRLKLASLYVDQFPDRDMAREMAARHKVPIFDTIEDALTLQSGQLAVDGVLSIGEHGDYPWNEKEQHLYPRRRFFSEIAATMERFQCVVPVFNDKHLGPVWEDALWMYQRAESLKIPFMAGSSLPVSFRTPNKTLPFGSQLNVAVGVGYSGLDIYGIHTLEVFQSVVEQRRNGESGVRSVQWFPAPEMWQLVDNGTVPIDLLNAALAVTPKNNSSTPLKELRGDGVGLFYIDYVDGLRGAVFMLPGYLAGCGMAADGEHGRLAFHAEERREPHYPHFAYLLKAIETMVHTGKPAYPVERTLLTSGILDRALTSRFQGGKKMITPELHIDYRPVPYPHAPAPPLEALYQG